jgi:hypothetical protein
MANVFRRELAQRNALRNEATRIDSWEAARIAKRQETARIGERQPADLGR